MTFVLFLFFHISPLKRNWLCNNTPLGDLPCPQDESEETQS